ncbi:MAG: hypothetical protein F6K11_00270 [Leptolyngbya sp. SIO3F4]|nr:hypothetical protein [Leptolyngbya sp. SIO3F4]
MFRSTCLSLSFGVAIVLSLSSEGQAQSFAVNLTDGFTKLDRAICLQQWGVAIDIASELITSPEVSTKYRQELLDFRRQLQVWQFSPVLPDFQASCDRTLPLFLSLDEPETSEPRPLDWNRALASLRSSSPIIQLNDSSEAITDSLPGQLTANSPELLTAWATPIDTTDGFNVVWGNVNGQQHWVYSFLARLGDRVSLEVDVTRFYNLGDAQLYIFDQTGSLLTQSDRSNFQGGTIQDFITPETNVYFVVVSSQGTTPVLDTRRQIIDWQSVNNASFDYTLTLTGVTPYNALFLP